ncbi:MAG: 4Fe-4S binding protein, partial [Lachnospiraceae bacterium]|nr:4Fe-4S binding protein [Lachnospiraceae bacterium]
MADKIKDKIARNKKYYIIQTVRVIIQILAFVLVPGLFISIFSSMGSIYTALISGSFTIAEYGGQIALLLGAIIITIIWGRFFCGFICSFGAFQDLMRAIGKRIFKDHRIPEKADRILKYLKFVILSFIILGVWTLGIMNDIVWSPWTVFGYYSDITGFGSMAYLFSLGGALLLLIMIGSMFTERFFCRYLCPLGAVFTLFGRIRLFKLRKKDGSCGNCRLCTSKCSMSIPVSEKECVASGECINCMKCSALCPRENIGMVPSTAAVGTLSATVLAGSYFLGTLPVYADDNTNNQPVNQIMVQENNKDGTYTGTGRGYRGDTTASVTVENGIITDITIESYSDDRQFFSKAQSGIISRILSSQSTDVDAVSGATYSSKGIIAAVADALGIEYTNTNSAS